MFGRSARQGDPGSVEAIVSLDNELFRRYAPTISRAGAAFGLGSSPRHARLFRWLVVFAQSNAERHARKIRLETLRRDRKWLEALGFVGSARK